MSEFKFERQENNYFTGGVQKIRTMIEGFDDISHGGLPLGRATLFSGTSGTGKTLFSIARWKNY